jgi:hypothetical protein
VYGLRAVVGPAKAPKKLQETKPRGPRTTPLSTLETVVLAHNALLCLWSLAMFAGMSWSILQEAQRLAWSFSSLLCLVPQSGGLAYWTYIYYLSKFYELLDTVILVLKRKPLSFLQIYHHVISA